MAVVAIFNQKGGVGKTTTTFNLASRLVALGRHPIAFDLDPQASLTLCCGLNGVDVMRSLAAFYKYDRPLADLIRTMPSGLRLIPAHAELSRVNSMYGGRPGVAGKLRQGMETALAWEDVPILMDCCPSLGVLTLNAVFAADRVLLPVTPDYLSMQSLNRLDAALDVLERPLRRKIDRCVVITRYNPDNPNASENCERLQSRYGDLLCATRIREDPWLASSPEQGRSVFDTAPDSPGSEDHGALAVELLAKGFFS
jgi:chromosome partitioning protein